MKNLSLLLLFISCWASAQVNGIWKELGPTDFPPHENWQIAGVARISQMKFHPTDPNTLYAVNAMGGLFITNDGGLNWRATGADALPATRCASVCVDHTNDNVIYFGTGDLSYYSQGYGIWKSTDGGVTFNQKNNTIGNRLAVELLMAPDNNQEVIAATNDGIWKTSNGGDSWQVVKGGGDFTDMVFKPGSNNVVYACTRSEFWKSTDQGDNWTRVNLPGNGIQSGGRIAVSAQNANVVYLTFVGNNGGGTATPVLRSTDEGNSFSIRKTAGGINLNGYDENSNGQGNYNYAMAADPSNADHLFACGHIIWESTNGGQNWTKISVDWANQVHTDMRQTPFSPFDSNIIYNINDGGIWRSTDGGKSFLPICNGLTGTESYVGCQSPVKKEAISIGAQDNGEFIYVDGQWFNNAGGDVHRNMVHDNISADYYYDLSGNGRRRYLPTGAFVDLNMPFNSSDGNAQDVFTDFPLTSTNVGYFAYFDVYRADNLSNNPPSWTKISNFNKRVKAVASSPNDANVLYVVTDDGKIRRSDNALSGSPSFTTYNTPSATNVTASVAVVKSNSDIVFMVCNNKTYRSTNKGANWTEITGSLPNTNYHKILHDVYSTNEAMYLAGYNTVWYRDNSTNGWLNYSDGLPSIVNFRRFYMYNDGTDNSVLTAITGGRSVFWAGLYGKNILRKPENPEDIIPGIVYTYHETGVIDHLPIFSALTPTKTGAVANVSLDARLRDDRFAMTFDGYIDVPEDGKYTFYLSSDDGSRMLIGDKIVVNHDGNHGTSEREGYAWLEKGKHVFTIQYYEGVVDHVLEWRWEGPSFSKQLVPSNVLWRLAPETICPENGRILVERWNNVGGSSVSDIPTGNTPTETEFLTRFESEPTDGDNYGQRFRGFLCPPYTGNYTFYVSSDDQSELWLSSDDDPANRERIAFLGTAVQLRNWYKYPSQKSIEIYLEAGRQYYIEALHKEGGGGDNFAVAWMTPAAAFEAPIPGRHLSPYTTNPAPSITLTAPAQGASFEQGTNVSLTADASDNGSVTKVEFFVDDLKVGEDDSSPYSLEWMADLIGNHKVHARAVDNDGRVTSTSKVTISVFSLRDPENPEFALNGLDYYYFEGSWTALPDFGNMFSLDAGTVAHFDIGVRNREDNFGLLYEGFVDVPTDGYYEFVIDSDDGSAFYIGDELVVSRDGIHGMGTPQTGGIGLKAGKHICTLEYFQGVGGKGLSLAYSGPGISQVAIPNSALYRQTFENTKPTVALQGTSTAQKAPADVNLTATASDADGTVALVKFYVDGALIGSQSAAPYTQTSSSLSEGTYTFTAVAIDDRGDSTTSNNVVIIIGPSNTAPNIAITSPADGAMYSAPASIAITLAASDDDGSVASLEIYNGAILLTTLTVEPFNFTWEDVPEGEYDLTAKAIDDEGATTISAIVQVSVDGLVAIDPFELPESNVIKIYPNPVFDVTKVDVELENEDQAILQVIDARGVVFQSHTVNGSSTVTLDVSQLSDGQYFVKIIDGQQVHVAPLYRIQKPENEQKANVK